MAPYSSTGALSVMALEAKQEVPKLEQPKKVIKTEHKGYFETKVRWENVISITLLHILSVYVLITFPYLQKFGSFLFAYLVGILCGFGVTAGAHRLWCHRTYKATLPLRIFLIFCYTMAGQNTIYEWVRDHRVHHRFSETSSDPHDSNRGFFFSHCGWLMLKKHADVIEKGRELDMSDITNDPVIKYHVKYFVISKILLCFILPAMIPYYLWGEDLLICLAGNLTRYCLTLNFTWSVNSAAHLYGTKPYDKNIQPRENRAVSFFALGEGWHNYHHTFPWDYKAGELGKWNVTAFWLRVFEKMGLAYDLREPSQDLVQKVIEKSGDGTYEWGTEVEDTEKDA